MALNAKQRAKARPKKAKAEQPRIKREVVGAKLNARQQSFVDLYDGNGTRSAELAGYTGDKNTLGQTAHQLLRNPKIREAIFNRQRRELGPHIATRQERQRFWTRIMLDESRAPETRLRAAELLGKSEADFTEVHQVSGKDGGPVVMLTMPANGSERLEDSQANGGTVDDDAGKTHGRDVDAGT